MSDKSPSETSFITDQDHSIRGAFERLKAAQLWKGQHILDMYHLIKSNKIKDKAAGLISRLMKSHHIKDY